MKPLSISLGLTVLFTSLAYAASGGMISGTVKAPDGAPFKGAFVQARNLKSKITMSVLSDRQGQYRMQNLPPGEYDVKAIATGYKSEPRRGMKLDAGQSVSLDFAMQKGRVRWNDLSVYQYQSLLPEGKGKAILFGKGTCTGCHGISTRYGRRSEKGWIDAVTYMRTRFDYFLADRINDSEAAEVTAYLTRVFGEDSELPRYPEVSREEFSDEAMKIIYVDYDLPTPKAFPWSAYPDKDGNIWIPEYNTNQVGRLDLQTGVIQEFRVPNSGTAEIHSAVPAPDGTVWLAESSGVNKLAKLDPRSQKFTEYQDPYPKGRKHTVRIDSKGNVWTSGNPVTRFDPTTEKFTHFPETGTTYGIGIDKEDNVWFTQLAEGKIGKINAKTGKVTKWDPPTPNSGTRRVKIDDQGMMWFAEYNAGKIGRFDPKTETFKEYPLNAPSPNPYAWGFDNNNHIWYVSFQRDMLGRVDPRTGEVVEYPMPYLDNGMREFFMDSEGRVWFGTTGFNKVGYFYLRSGE